MMMMIMEVKNMSTKLATTNNNKYYMEEKGAHEEEVVDNIDDDHDDVPLPGFRFHPTDEELVGFYLRRKVEKKAISIELIKQADIYKYDPWDLPKSTNVGEKDKEWYFFCKRGRKYKNSVRPNRVTGSGFWKATGIDRPILSGRDCIGLKKSLVYYRGSAGKGTKTEWMMHEFRLPTTKHIVAQEAEVWTLCRILKRSVPYRKCVPDWRLVGVNKKSSSGNIVLIDPPISEACSVESNDHRDGPSSYISFSAPIIKQNNFDNDKRLYFSSSGNAVANSNIIDRNEFSGQQYFKLQAAPAVPAAAGLCSSFPSYNSIIDGDINELLRHADWEDLRSVVANSSSMY